MAYLSVSEGLRAASALSVASSNGIVSCEQKMYVSEANKCFFDDDFRQDLCAGEFSGC